MSSIEAVQNLRQAGLDTKVAEAMVIQLEKIIDNRVATKADLSEVKAALKADLSDLKAEIQASKVDMLKAISDSKHSMLMWVVGLLVLALFVNGAAIWVIRTSPVAPVAVAPK